MRSDAGTDAATDAADTGKRLTLLLAALLWDNEECLADIYERHAAEDDGLSPDLRLAELTEDGRVEILADGREYVLRLESKPR